MNPGNFYIAAFSGSNRKLTLQKMWHGFGAWDPRIMQSCNRAKLELLMPNPKSTVKKKNDEGDHGGSPLQDFVGAGPRACPDTPGPMVSIHAIRIGKF
jgi:hypothetical protein